MIGLVNYGVGNLRSVLNALRWIEAPAQLIDTPAQLEGIRGLILPGVGAFIPAMERLRDMGFIGPLRKWALDDRKPLLGVCLGMQLLAATGTEGAEYPGLGIIDARVARLTSAPGVRVPHVGWNRVRKLREARLWGNLEQAECYFVHSYQLSFADRAAYERTVIGETDNGGPIVAMVSQDNVLGAQFHPEKSQRDGLAILKNFAELSREW
jgi:glutamine amidotransferase